jgi:hypothetical protein
MSHVLRSIDHTICSFSGKLQAPASTKGNGLPLRKSFYIGDSFLGRINDLILADSTPFGGAVHTNSNLCRCG